MKHLVATLAPKTKEFLESSSLLARVMLSASREYCIISWWFRIYYVWFGIESENSNSSNGNIDPPSDPFTRDLSPDNISIWFSNEKPKSELHISLELRPFTKMDVIPALYFKTLSCPITNYVFIDHGIARGGQTCDKKW